MLEAHGRAFGNEDEVKHELYELTDEELEGVTVG